MSSLRFPTERVKPVVMIVEDELAVLLGLERKLGNMRKKWDMVFYSDPRDALDHLTDGPIDLVVSDVNMPGMGGGEFLAKVAEIVPRTIRFAMSDRADGDDIEKLAGICHQVLAKPCDAERLVQQAQRALATRELLPDAGVQTKVARIRDLPSRPEVHDLLVRELTSDAPSFESIAALVGEDIALTAKVLHIASLEFFKAENATPGLLSAVTTLGIRRVMAVVRHHGAESACAAKIPDTDFLESLWLHSLACAMLGQAIAAGEKLPIPTIESAFVAGLLHDIGRLAMAASEPDAYMKLNAELADADSAQSLGAETRLFKAAHPQIGAYLVGLWGLPQDIVHAVAYHHAPSHCPDRTIGPLALLHAAEAFSRIPDGVDEPPVPRLDIDYFRSLGLADRLADWQAIATALLTPDPDH